MKTGYVLVTGADGQLGIELARAAWPSDWVPVPSGRGTLNLADPIAIALAVAMGHEGQARAAAINGAAYILDELIGAASMETLA